MGLDLDLVDWPTIVLQCFVTVGWVIWPVKIVPGMTYNVFGGTLNPTLLLMTSHLIYWVISYLMSKTPYFSVSEKWKDWSQNPTNSSLTQASAMHPQIFMNIGPQLWNNLIHRQTNSQCCIQGLMTWGEGQGLDDQGQGLEVQGQGLVNWSTWTKTRTFLEDNNTGLQWRMAYLLTYISK